MTIDEKIKHEYDNMLNSIMPMERKRHADRIIEIENERDLQKDTGSGWAYRDRGMNRGE